VCLFKKRVKRILEARGLAFAKANEAIRLLNEALDILQANQVFIVTVELAIMNFDIANFHAVKRDALWDGFLCFRPFVLLVCYAPEFLGIFVE